jgi:hypothetical protein
MDQLQAPMLLRVPTGDFVLETEVATEPGQWYQGAGLVLWNGSESYVRLERGFGDVGAVIFEYRNGGPHVKVHSPSRDDPQLIQTDADPVVLKLSKTSDAVSARWRPAQDQQWQELGTIAMALPDSTKAGVAVLNRAQNQCRVAKVDLAVCAGHRRGVTAVAGVTGVICGRDGCCGGSP